MRERFGSLAVFLLLGVQVAGIVRARFAEDRFFAWAPLHEVATFEFVEPVESTASLAHRFAIPTSAWTAHGTFRELNALSPVLARIRRVACTSRPAVPVLVRYRRNGRPGEAAVRCPR